MEVEQQPSYVLPRRSSSSSGGGPSRASSSLAAAFAAGAAAPPSQARQGPPSILGGNSLMGRFGHGRGSVLGLRAPCAAPGAASTCDFGELACMLESGESAKVENALRSINNMVGDVSSHAEIIEKLFSRFPRLLTAGQADADRQISLALSRFAQHRNSAVLIENINGMQEAVMDLMRRTSVSIRVPASRAFALLCIFGVTTRARLVGNADRGAVSSIVELLGNDSGDFRNDAIRCLFELCQDGQSTLVQEAGAVNAACGVLFASSIPYISGKAAELLCVIASASTEACESVNQTLCEASAEGKVLLPAAVQLPAICSLSQTTGWNACGSPGTAGTE